MTCSLSSEDYDSRKDRCITIVAKGNRRSTSTQHHTFRGGSLIVWTGISLWYRTYLYIYKHGAVTTVRYQNEALNPNVKLHAAAVGFSFVLMGDNVRPYVAATFEGFLESQRVERMERLTLSPSINRLKNLETEV
ncbi:transposable element Tcb1 transposase [Trichonephila clavipes]|nr:transposable element Tcb1 transposase [Trichonephila clavipes]